MGKKIFWIFISFVLGTSFLVAYYIQSSHFAALIKDKFESELRYSLGMKISFDRLDIKLLPPSISMINVRVEEFDKKNVLDIPDNSIIKSEKVGVTFRMFQTFSGVIHIEKIFLEGALIKIKKYQKKSVNKDKDFSISDFIGKEILIKYAQGMSILVRRIEMKKSTVDLEFGSKEKANKVFAEKITAFSITPKSDQLSVIVDINNIAWNIDGNAQKLEIIKGNFDLRNLFTHIYALDFKRNESTIHVEGDLIGNIDDYKKLKADLRIISRANTAALSEFVPELEDGEGNWFLELLLKGTINDYDVSGNIKLNDFKLGLWELDEFKSKVKLKNRLFEFRSTQIQRDESKIIFEPIILNFNDEIVESSFDVRLSDFDAHKLMGELKKDINNLEFQTNGVVSVSFTLNREKKRKFSIAKLSVKPNLDVKQMKLTNHVWRKRFEKKKTIFTLKNFKVLGSVLWDGKSLDVSGSELQFQTGTMKISGNFIPEKGYNMTGVAETVNLGKEVGKIVNSEIEGFGKVSITARGPAKNIFFDFDLDVQDGKFIGLDLGSVDGLAILDEDKSQLFLKDVKGLKNTSKYRVNGIVDLSGEDKIDLSMELVKTVPEDVFQVFNYLLEDLHWVPRGLQGTMVGNAKIRGTFADPERTLDISGSVHGTRLQYKGELIESFYSRLGLKDGTFFAKNSRGRKYNSVFWGHASYDQEKKLKYKFETSNARLRDFDFLSKIGFPLDSQIQFKSEGSGKIDQLVSKTKLELKKVYVHTLPLNPVSMTLNSDKSKLDFSFASKGMNAKAEVFRKKEKQSSFSSYINKTNLSFVICFLNPKFCKSNKTLIDIDAKVDFKWNGMDWHKLNGSAYFKKARFVSEEFHLEMKSENEIVYKNGDFKSDNILFEGDGSNIEINTFGKVSGEFFSTKVKGICDFNILQVLTPLIERAKGNFLIDANLRGSSKKFDMLGKVALENGRLKLRGIPSIVENLNGFVSLRENRAQLNNVKGLFGRGFVNVSGYVDFFPDNFPVFNLEMNMENNRVQFFPVNIANVKDGKMSFKGNKPPYELAGNVNFRNAKIRMNFDDTDGKQLKTSKFLPNKGQNKNWFYNLNIKAQANNGILVKNDLLDAEFKGEITLLNNFDFPQVTGKSELIKGRLFFRNTAFSLSYAIIKFPNSSEFNPQFSIGGAATVDRYKVNLFISGNKEFPQINITSTPPLPQEDILSMLAFGFSGKENYNAKSTAEGLNAITYTEMGSILLDQLKLNKDLKSKGFNVTVVPTLRQDEANIVRPKTEGETVVPKIKIKTKLTKRLDASVGTTLEGAQNEIDLNLEYHLNNKISVQGVYEQTPGTDAGEEIRSSYGGDLRFRWGFK